MLLLSPLMAEEIGPRKTLRNHPRYVWSWIAEPPRLKSRILTIKLAAGTSMLDCGVS